jgi:hypothetical protein
MASIHKLYLQVLSIDIVITAVQPHELPEQDPVVLFDLTMKLALGWP